jgi:glycosidase
MRTCWFETFVADLNWTNPAVLDRALDDTIWWIDRFDVDGLRLDAVPMMPRYALRHLRARLDHRRPDAAPHVYLLGENYVGRGGQPQLAYFLGPHSLTGEFQFPLMWTLRDAMAGDAPMAALDRVVRSGRRLWRGSGSVMAPFLGNHDVRRFTTAMNERLPADASDTTDARLQLAWTFVLTQPGAPVIYYGDEIGLTGGPDPDNRHDMRFGDALTDAERATRRHVRRLGTLRDCSTALRRGDYTPVDAGPDHLVYARRTTDGEVAVVALNRSASAKSVRLNAPGPMARALTGDEAVPDDEGRIAIEVPALGSAVLVTEMACASPR